MESKINIILDFPNQMEIYKVLTAVDFGIYDILRNEKMVIFKDYDVDKLFEILTSYDVLYIDNLEKRANFDKTLIKTLRDKILILYKEKIENQIQNEE